MKPKLQPDRVASPVPEGSLASLLGDYVVLLGRLASLLKAIHALSDEHSDTAHLAMVGQWLAGDMCDLATFFMEQVKMYGVLEGVEQGTASMNRKVAAARFVEASSTVEFLQGAMENCLGLVGEARTAKMRAYHKGRADAFQMAIEALGGEACAR